MSNALSLYASGAPNAQATVDIFKGTWCTKLPNGLVSGPADNFHDSRVALAERELGFNGKTVLELGPMEAGHTYGIHAHGAKSIVAIEGNSDCYLKCLIVKEMYDLERAKFLYGDFLPYLEQEDQRFDIIFASGVLYHMAEPLKLLAEIKKHTDKTYIWTGFYDKVIMEPAYGDQFKKRFGEPVTIRYGDFTCEGIPQWYEDMLGLPNYVGGASHGSTWLRKDDIVRFLRYLGFDRVDVFDVDLSYGYAPRFSIVAETKSLV